MSQTIQAPALALVESIARVLPKHAQEDFRLLLRDVVLQNLTSLSPGGNLLQPGGAQPGASRAPVGVTHTTTGANAVATVSITNPPSPTPIYHEISYCSIISFTKGVTTLPPTTETNVNIQAPGFRGYVRIRSSFDKKTWSNYQLSSTSPIDAGLVESSAIAAGASFNQTNFGVVNSAAAGSAAAVTISGTGGILTPYTAVKGIQQEPRPSATIVGVTPQSDQFVGWDGAQFHLRPTLASVLADDLEPVGKVSVVSTAVPTLPVIHPLIVGGGIVGYNVISGGTGASQPYTITITDGPGSGATAGTQTIVGGVLIAVAPGNAGSSYDGSTTVTASGGGPGGSPGGGTSSGGNGGRLTAV